VLCDISLEDAQEIVLQKISVVTGEDVNVFDAAGRIIAEDIFANEDLPRYPQSAVDGFALGDSLAKTDSTYRILEYLGLSDWPRYQLKQGEAAGVLTGGIIPDGTRAVVPHEKTLIQGNRLSVLEQVKPGNNIKQIGEDFKQEELLVACGTRIDSGCAGVLAAYGLCQVPVFRQPRVTIISLGANVVPCWQKPLPGQTRDCNSALLAALIKQYGGVLYSVKLANGMNSSDRKSYIDKIIGEVDLIICTGETYTKEMNSAPSFPFAEEIGAEVNYYGIRIQPGSHNGAAFYKGCPIFALSGNPAACAVGFHLLVAPALRAMQGQSPYPRYLRARCTNDFAKKVLRSRRFVRGHARYSSEGWEVTILPKQKPSMVRSLISCNALIDLTPEQLPITKGTEVSVLLLESLF
jgi:molybdopterin molybdotransferase